jgi:cation transporter-like permease
VIGSFITWGRTETKWHVVIVIVVTVLASIIAYAVVGSLIFVLSIIAFKREIDPDNFAIPLTACLADLATAGLIIAFSYAMLLPLV